MNSLIRSPKDFWAGLLYAGFGGAAVLIARDYGMGSSSRMGPGYFPTVLGGLLLLIGIASLVRSFLVTRRADRCDCVEGTALVTAATVLFGVLLRPAGLDRRARGAHPGQRRGERRSSASTGGRWR